MNKPTENVPKDETPSSEDRDWLRGIVDAHAAALTRYAESVCRDPERARDAVQETFLRLCKQERANVEDKMPAWLFRVCRNYLIDLSRKAKPVNLLDEEQTARLRDDAPNPAAAASRSDEAERALAFVEELPERQREVVRLKFQNGLSYKEIADVMDLTVTNVGFILHTAIKKLREMMMAAEMDTPEQQA